MANEISQSDITPNVSIYDQLIQAQLERPTQVDVAPLQELLNNLYGTNTKTAPLKPTGKEEVSAILEAARQEEKAKRQELLNTDLKLAELRMDERRLDAQIRAMDAVAKGNLVKAAEALAGEKGDDKFSQKLRQDFAKSDEGKKLKANIKYSNALNDYLAKVKEYGTVPFGSDTTPINRAYAQLQTAFKEAEELGALVGADWTILHNAIPPVTGFVGLGRAITSGGAPAAEKALQEALEGTKRSYNDTRNSAKEIYPYEAIDGIVKEYDKQFLSSLRKDKSSTNPVNTPVQPEEKVMEASKQSRHPFLKYGGN